MIRPLPLFTTVGLILATAAYLLWLGRSPICDCGYVLLWHGEVMSDENSQHLTDWYTPSHVLHGILFFGALWVVARRLSFGWRLAIATLVESTWEIVENSDAVIDRYRTATAALDYYGDSVLNTVSDLLAMVLGFWLASRLPVWASVAIVIGAEVVTITLIRDGLALNILQLLWPSDAISAWQTELWGAPPQ